MPTPRGVEYHPMRVEGPLPVVGSSGVVLEDDSITNQLCGAPSTRPGGLWYTESIDLSNDPRFMGDTILDKRLAAFTALSIIASISTGAVCDNFFPFFDVADIRLEGWNHHPWRTVRTVIQLIGFLMMSFVLFVDVVATLVFATQFYFAYKLMTSGPIGFESARGFYKDPQMTAYRSKAALGLVLGLPLFVLATGCMLYAKFDKVERDAGVLHHSVCLTCFGVFFCMALCIFRVGLDHQRVFSSKCRMGNHVTPLLQNLDSPRRYLA